MILTDRPPVVEAPAAPVRRRRVPGSQLVAGGILLLIGALWMMERLGWIDLTVTSVLAIATVVVGVALMLLARDGAHPGLIIMGTILGLLAFATAAAPFEGFQGGIGDRTIVIESVDDIAGDYNQAMGTLTIDLTQVEGLAGVTELSASVGTGELLILVPEDVAIQVDARMGAGQIQLFDETFDGIGLTRSYETAGVEGFATIALELEVFAGRLEVRS